MSPDSEKSLSKYLSPLGAWALAFGCSVGWGCFVMPGTNFLPQAGPLGTAIGMIIGGLVMLVMGYNCHYMMNKYSGYGGIFTYTKNELGYDHGFLSTWFLLLVYIAIIWANATAIPIILRYLLGEKLMVGFHYEVAGYSIYFGEIVVSLTALFFAALVSMLGGRLSARIQIFLCLLLIGGIVFCAGYIYLFKGIVFTEIKPSYVPGRSSIIQILHIVTLAPWAYVGFESISNSTQGFAFDKKKSIWVILAAIVTAAVAYCLMGLIAVASIPEEYPDWVSYLNDLPNLEGIRGLPTFYTIYKFMGKSGVVILWITTLSAIFTGLIGNTIAASRIIYTIAKENLIPKKYCMLSERRVPIYAVMLVLLISLPIPFLGRTAIGWVVDISSIGATLSYCYISVVVLLSASKADRLFAKITGAFGFVVSFFLMVHFLVPDIWSVEALSKESYFLLMIWGMLGFVFFRYVIERDKQKRFGNKTIVWIFILAMVFFVSLLWVRQATQEHTKEVLERLDSYNVEELSEHGVSLTNEEKDKADIFIRDQVEQVSETMHRNSIIQMIIIVIVLIFMFNIFNVLQKREKDMEMLKIKSDESNKIKNMFLSNISRDLRTPVNEIIGYAETARKFKDLPAEATEYLDKIDESGEHLIAVISDILDMSLIESGDLKFDISSYDIEKVVLDATRLFENKMAQKEIEFSVNTEEVINQFVYCDGIRITRALMNVLNNAYKYTHEGGNISVVLSQMTAGDDKADYEIRVKDSGSGMSADFAEKVFYAYDKKETPDNIKGTGFGMTVTKGIIDRMGGSIVINRELKEGAELIIKLTLRIDNENV